MKITTLELPTKDLQAQRNFYSKILELPVKLSAENLEVQAGETSLIFTQADADFDGAYHFAFNIPENQFQAAKAWLARRTPILQLIMGKRTLSQKIGILTRCISKTRQGIFSGSSRGTI